LVFENFLSILGALENNGIHDWSISSLVVKHAIDWNVRSLGVKTQRSNPKRVNVHELIILAIPSFVMKVEQVFTIWGFDYKLDCCLAPYVFGITHVYLLSGFDLRYNMTIEPNLILCHPVLPS